MLFEQRLWAGLADGTVTVTFRRRRRPRARALLARLGPPAPSRGGGGSVPGS